MRSAFASASFIVALSSHAPQDVIVVRFLAVHTGRGVRISLTFSCLLFEGV